MDVSVKSFQNKKQTASIIFIIVGCFFIFYLAAIIPAQKKLKVLEKKIAAARQEIDRIEVLTKGEKIERITDELGKRSQQLRKHFAPSERIILSLLTTEAARLDLNVQSIVPYERVSCTAGPANNKEAFVVCEGLPITLKMSGEFRLIAKYLAVLEYKFPFLLNIKNLRITSRGSGNAAVDLVVEIIAYVAQSKSGSVVQPPPT